MKAVRTPDDVRRFVAAIGARGVTIPGPAPRMTRRGPGSAPAMREIVPGLWHWSTQHPNLGQEVSSYLVGGSAAALDPMVPGEGLVAFDGVPTPRHVVLTSRHHERDHAQFVQSFGAVFHVSEHGVGEYPGEDIVPYAVGDEIVPGLTAVANGPIAPDDTVLRVDVEGGALAFADSLLNDGGRVGFMPDGLLGEDPDQVRADISAAVRELLETQEFEHVLFAHGDPIIGGGRDALAALVQNPS